MRLIKQTDDTGCGIACIAALLDIDYQSVKDFTSSILKWSPKKKNLRTHPKDLIQILENYDIKSEADRFEKTKLLNVTYLAGVNCDGKGNYHWVVFVGTGTGFVIYDPETAELYQGPDWLNVEDGYMIKNLSKRFVRVDLNVSEIKI